MNRAAPLCATAAAIAAALTLVGAAPVHVPLAASGSTPARWPLPNRTVITDAPRRDRRYIFDAMADVFNTMIDNHAYPGPPPPPCNSKFVRGRLIRETRLSSYPVGRPEICSRGAWVPICGHWMWDNDNAVAEICKAHGYGGGSIVRRVYGIRVDAPGAPYVGRCKPGEVPGTRNSCSEGVRHGFCAASQASTVVARCGTSTPTGPAHTSPSSGMTCRRQSLPSYEGAHYKSVPGPMNREECEQLCTKEPECNAIAWERNGNNYCHLKDGFDVLSAEWGMPHERLFDFCYSKPYQNAEWLDLSGRATAQSSTGWGGEAARAIDGNVNSDYRGNSCTHTEHNYAPWWQVDLGAATIVTAVKVTNRGDCCGERLSGFQVTVDGQVCRSGVTLKAGETMEITCAAPTVGRYVRVEIPGRHEYLTLCEVGVRGAAALSRGKVVARDLTMPADFTLAFRIYPTAIEREWASILHYSNGGDSNRVPGIWFWPGTTKLHVVVGPNDYRLNPDYSLPLNRLASVRVQVVGATAKITINGRDFDYTGLPARPAVTAGVTQYAADPWSPPARAPILIYN